MSDPASPAVQRALDIDASSTATQRTIDITTTGARTGRPRRIETWLYRHEDRWFLSGLPGRRGWYANLLADPRLVVHLKHGVRADLPALATRIEDPEERARIFAAFVADLNQPHNPGRLPRPTRLQDWMAGSPLAELHFLHLGACGTTTGTTVGTSEDTTCAP